MQAAFEKYTTEQLNYNSKRDGLPIPINRRLPPKLIMVCKGLQHLHLDFYADVYKQWIVSARFYQLLQGRQLLADHYEACELTVVSTKNQPLATSPYYLLRFYRDDSDLLDFARSSAVPSTQPPLTPETPPLLYYPSLVFKPGVEVPAMLYVENKAFLSTFLCNEEIKQIMEEENYQGFDFYTLPDYVEERHYRERYPYGPPSDKPQPLP